MKVSAEQVWFVASFFSQWAYKYSSLTIGITIAFGIRKKKKKNPKEYQTKLYLLIYLSTYLFMLAPLEML